MALGGGGGDDGFAAAGLLRVYMLWKSVKYKQSNKEQGVEGFPHELRGIHKELQSNTSHESWDCIRGA